jgi:hypothetical protein
MKHKTNYLYLLEKLSLLVEKSEYDLFHIAAKRFNWPRYHVEPDFKKYLKSGCKWMPSYVKQFLDEGKEHIIKCKLFLFQLPTLM